MKRRNTIQKELILNAVKRLHSHATAEEVYAEIQKEYPSIGKATVYRNLKLLSEDGQIKRIEFPCESERFDDTCSDHYHIKCEKCGKIFDVDMDLVSGLTDKIKDKHGFTFNSYQIVFKGICPNCQ
ncbi:MAG: transcriptional repressor [Oscillospiraceae bacterium]|nr:transcriptional repressor [Candidatus Limimonas coprohippi]